MDFEDFDPRIRKIIKDAFQERIMQELAKQGPLLFAKQQAAPRRKYVQAEKSGRRRAISLDSKSCKLSMGLRGNVASTTWGTWSRETWTEGAMWIFQRHRYILLLSCDSAGILFYPAPARWEGIPSRWRNWPTRHSPPESRSESVGGAISDYYISQELAAYDCSCLGR